MTRQLVPGLRVLGLTALGLVLSHQAMFLVVYGASYNEALGRTGHGKAWADAVTVVVAGSVLLLALALGRLHRLRALLRTAQGNARPAERHGRLGVRTISEPQLRGFLRTWLGLALLVGVSITIALTAQENLEHVAAGHPAPGVLLLLGPEYPMALPIIGAVAMAVALVAALLGWQQRVLIARLRAARSRFRPLRAAVAVAQRVVPRPRPANVLARSLGRRAPPVAVAA